MPPVLTQWQRRACPFPRKKRSRGKRQKTHEILGVAPLHCNPGMLNFRTEMAIEHDRVSFGVFEVDRQARELRKHGVRIRLEDQPFEILTALLEKPGDIVTRGELRARLWPEGTFVDFDKGLTKAVNKIRTALDDSPTNPRFIETLSRRGYRFIAPVLDEEPHALATDGEAPAQVVPGKNAVPRPHPWRRRILWVAAGLMLLLALAGSLNLGRVRDRMLHARD